MTIPYPVVLLRLGILVVADGAPPYRQRLLLASDPAMAVAETANFFTPAGELETGVIGGPIALDAGDYLVTFSGQDTCYGIRDGISELWAVVLH